MDWCCFAFSNRYVVTIACLWKHVPETHPVACLFNLTFYYSDSSLWFSLMCTPVVSLVYFCRHRLSGVWSRGQGAQDSIHTCDNGGDARRADPDRSSRRQRWLARRWAHKPVLFWSFCILHNSRCRSRWWREILNLTIAGQHVFLRVLNGRNVLEKVSSQSWPLIHWDLIPKLTRKHSDLSIIFFFCTCFPAPFHHRQCSQSRFPPRVSWPSYQHHPHDVVRDERGTNQFTDPDWRTRFSIHLAWHGIWCSWPKQLEILPTYVPFSCCTLLIQPRSS